MEASINASRVEPINGSLDLEFAIEWNRIILQFLGIWPNSKSNSCTLLIRFIFAVVFVLCLNIPQIIYFIMVWGQLDLMIEVLAKSMALTITGLLKLIGVRYHGKVLGLLLSSVAEDWLAPKDKKEWEIMKKNAKVARTLSMGGIFLIFGTLNIYTLNHILIRMRTPAKNATVFTWELLFHAYIPFDTDSSPNYELTCVLQFVAASYTAMAYTGIDTFIAMLILHLCAQLTNLQTALKNIASDIKYRKHIEFREKLAIVVSRHQHLNRFAESIEKSFNALLLVHMLFCTIQFCLIGYSFISNSNSSEKGRLPLSQFLFFVIYVISGLLQLFIYCYVGEQLNVESTKLSEAAYMCEWYKLTVHETRDLMFLMLRAQSPLQITAGKFCSFTLSQFSYILKASMGYLSVLLSVSD